MRYFLQVFLLLLLVCVPRQALPTSQDKPGPETIDLKMGSRATIFQHWKHQKLVGNDCLHCHDRRGEKIKGWGEQTAHKICIPCHDLDEKGPVACHECHDKKPAAPRQGERKLDPKAVLKV